MGVRPSCSATPERHTCAHRVDELLDIWADLSRKQKATLSRQTVS
jgi:hypothetical protein